MTPEEKAAAAEKKRKADSNRDKKKAKQAKKAAASVGGGAPPAAAAQGGAAANASLGLDFDPTAETAKLEATMGKDSAGKSPCYFHHTAGKKCRYEAADCKRYH